MDFISTDAIIILASGLGLLLSQMAHYWKSKKSLLILNRELQNNGGSSMKDAIDRIEHKLHNLELHQKFYLDESSSYIYEIDIDGHFVWGNKAYLEAINKDTENIHGIGWILHVAPEDRKKVEDHWDVCRELEKECTIEFRFLKHTGERVWVIGSTFPLNDIDGNIYGYLRIIKPIKK
jgi:PAS domain S-box-containing protein